MKSDLDIERSVKLRPVAEIAGALGIGEDELELFGRFKAKVSFKLIERISGRKAGKLILVTSMTPTPAGEGKTTVTIGLAQALRKTGLNSFICIREPSLGPCFGRKGGAAGGGFSQVAPMEDINLLFTGDIPAVTAANNLLSAVLDNHLHFGNKLNIDPTRVVWKRALDMNDRALRHVLVGLDGDGVSREESFVITAASEVMAVLCLSESIADLKRRLARMIVAYTPFGKPVRVRDLGVEGAMAALLRNTLKPNIVQSLEGCPAFVHGGPFANIAHGSSSLIATKTALRLADYVVTEAGFGADLGAEKFFNITCRIGALKPDAVVVVATLRALRMHGGASDYARCDLKAVERGFRNLEKQVENARAYGIPVAVALNRFPSDSREELGWVKKECEGRLKTRAFVVEVHARGGAGGIELACEVVRMCKSKKRLRFLYRETDDLRTKIEKIARRMYGARRVVYTKKAEEQLKHLEKEGLSRTLVCMAKTQKSLSDRPELLGRPRDFTLTVTGLKPSAGAGFVVAFAGNIMLMPGLPEKPNALDMDIDDSGGMRGLV